MGAGMIRCSSFSSRKGEPSEPSVNPHKSAWVHRFYSPFQCFAPVVNPVSPYILNKTLGDDTSTVEQWQGVMGRQHVSGGNIGKVGSLGSLGSRLGVTGYRSTSKFAHKPRSNVGDWAMVNGSFPRVPPRGFRRPRKKTLHKFSIICKARKIDP